MAELNCHRRRNNTTKRVGGGVKFLGTFTDPEGRALRSFGTETEFRDRALRNNAFEPYAYRSGDRN